MEVSMRTRPWLLVIALGVALVLRGQTESSMALTGQVTSAAEGPMEGVLVSAKKAASTITLTVVTDEQGRYRFPAAKLSPGQYSLRIRAAGYDTDAASGVEIVAGKTATINLKLKAAHD